MALLCDVPELAAPSEPAPDEADVARCLEKAARLVQNYADAVGPAGLTALLASIEEDPNPAAEQALALAKTAAEQTKILRDEVARFLSTTTVS